MEIEHMNQYAINISKNSIEILNGIENNNVECIDKSLKKLKNEILKLEKALEQYKDIYE